jgi:hypothetical protein
MTKILTGYVLRGLALAAVFAFVDGAISPESDNEMNTLYSNCDDSDACKTMGSSAGCSRKKGKRGKCHCAEVKYSTMIEELGDKYYCHYAER